MNNLIEKFMKENDDIDIRLSKGSRWMVYTHLIGELECWIVYEQRYGQRVKAICQTNRLELALEVLGGEEE